MSKRGYSKRGMKKPHGAQPRMGSKSTIRFKSMRKPMNTKS